eukprot:gene11226-4048_t
MNIGSNYSIVNGTGPSKNPNVEKYYLEISQQCIGAITKKTDQSIEGLCTKKLIECSALIMKWTKIASKGDDIDMVTLLHSDGSFDPQCVTQKFPEYKLVSYSIYQNKKDDDLVKDYACSLKLRPEERQLNYGEIYVKVNHKKKIKSIEIEIEITKPTSAKIMKYDKHELRKTINIMNSLFGYKECDLQYNGAEWTDMVKLKSDVEENAKKKSERKLDPIYNFDKSTKGTLTKKLMDNTFDDYVNEYNLLSK